MLIIPIVISLMIILDPYSSKINDIVYDNLFDITKIHNTL